MPVCQTGRDARSRRDARAPNPGPLLRECDLTRVAFATSADWPDLGPEDASLPAAFEARGFEVARAVWSRDDFSRFDHVILRSCWDYHRRHDDFLAWVDSLRARLWNPPGVVRWNARKRYLLDLQAHGIDAVPTLVASRGDLDAALAEATARGWDDAVFKPEISASAAHTWRGSPSRFDRGRLGAFSGDLLIQPFQPEVAEHGELALVVFGGRFSHGVLKRAAPGDFRVQREHGGTASRVEVEPALQHAAERIAAAAPEPPLYARVDGFVRAGKLVLMELELIEPELFLSVEPGASARFAGAFAAAAEL